MSSARFYFLLVWHGKCILPLRKSDKNGNRNVLISDFGYVNIFYDICHNLYGGLVFLQTYIKTAYNQHKNREFCN